MKPIADVLCHFHKTCLKTAHHELTVFLEVYDAYICQESNKYKTESRAQRKEMSKYSTADRIFITFTVEFTEDIR